MHGFELESDASLGRPDGPSGAAVPKFCTIVTDDHWHAQLLPPCTPAYYVSPTYSYALAVGHASTMCA